MSNVPRKRRIAVLGCSSVGKTSLTLRFTHKTFSDCYIPTIEDTQFAELNLQGRRYQLEVADTAGQETGSPGSMASTLNVDGWVLVFSTSNLKSFEYLRVLRKSLIESTGYMHLPMILVGNKVDLETDRQVPEEDVLRLSQEWNCPAIFTSAKTNKNVQEVFEKCLYEVEKSEGNIQEAKKCQIS